MTKSVASASRPKAKKAAPPMNEALVSAYLTRLQAAVGDEQAFMPIFEELRKDKGVKQVEAVALASRFVFELTPSTPKGKALDRIRQRHKDLYLFRLKQDAMAGRSAA